MNGATVGLAVALGLQLSNLLWDATLIVICLIGACLLCALIFGGLVIWDMLRRRKTVTHLAPRALPAVPPCPCCTSAPYRVNDCTCREPCGEPWCQAADGDLDVPDFLKEDRRG